MLEGLQFDHPPNVFHGVRFLLLGFDSINKPQVYNKLVQGGGVDVGQYGPRCTHVIVDKLTHDDPICVAAREDGKTLVTGLWVAHSFDVGMPVDPTSIMYRPLKDLKGIPGAKSLLVCLTGYQRQDRDDIMTMVSLMGANFSKPLVANKVTHLICYKFEGDKYELAKRTNRIKLVNHLWLEDCLKAWELLPEADYNKSGYELEVLEAEAKDSEEEADITLKNNQLLNPKQEFKIDQLDSSLSKDWSTVINTNDIASPSRKDRKSHHDHNVPESHVKESGLLDSLGAEAFTNVSCGKPVRSCERTAVPATVGDAFASTSRNERFAHSDASKLSSKRYDSETPKRTMSSMYSGDMTGKLSKVQMVNAIELNASDDAATMTEGLENKTDIGCFRTPAKPVLPHENRTCQAQKADHSSAARISAHSLEMNKSETFKPASSIGRPTEIRRSPACSTPVSETLDTEIRKKSDLVDAFQIFPMGTEKATLESNPDNEQVIKKQENSTSEALKISPPRRLETKKSSVSPNLSLHADAHVKSPTKMFGRKSWSKGGASKLKGSMHLSRSLPEDDPAISLNVEEKTKSNEMVEMIPAAIYLNANLGDAENDDLQPESKLHQIPMSMDDETETQEDNEENELRKVVIQGKDREVKADITRDNDKSEYLQRRKAVSNTETNGEENDGAKEKEITWGNRKSGESAASHIETCHEEEDANKQKAATCGKRKLGEASQKQNTAKKYTGRCENHPLSKIKKTANPPEASDADEENEILKAIDEDNCREVEPGILENYEEEKLKEAQHYESNCNTDRVHSRKTSGINKDGTKQKKATCGKRKLVESSHLENTVKDNKKAVNKHPLSKTNKRKVPSNSKTANLKEACNEEAEKEMNEDNILHSTGEPKNTKSINKLDKSVEGEKENRPVTTDHIASHGKNVRNLASTKAANKIGTEGCKSNLDGVELQRTTEPEPARFILSGHKLQRKEFQQVIRQLKGKVCKDSHQWSYQATHFIVPDPIRRTEKFFAAAASGRWILKTDYLSDSSRAGNLLAEEPYEWHKSGLSEDGNINLEAPRKWRLQRERTGHGAFYGMNVIIYGECIAPSLDTLKRVLKAGDGTILATSPPYTRFLGSGVNFAIVSPGMPHVDIWVQEFLRHEIPCVAADYLVEFVCKPGYSLERHVLYNTHAWAEKEFKNVVYRSEDSAELATPLRPGGESGLPCKGITTPVDATENDLPCQVCGSLDRGEEMLICGNESGTLGCGIGTHIDCCDPPLPDVPMKDWFCPKCSESKSSKKPSKSAKKKTPAAKRK